MFSPILRRPILTLFILVFGAFTTLVPQVSYADHTGSPAGQVGGFEVDGDFAFPHSPAIVGATTDWATLAGVIRANDPANTATDDSFGGGSKESEPDGWTFISHEPEDKADIVRVYAVTDVTASHAFLILGFERLAASGVGDVHIDFELNKSGSSVVNSKGASIPARTTGDLLVTYDYAGGGAVDVELFTWLGTAFVGAWVPQALPAGSALGDILAAPVTRPAIAPFGGGAVDESDFGEVAINLKGAFGSAYPGCPGFASAWAKTRSSGASIDSQLKDVVMPLTLDVSQCPNVRVSKSASQATVDASNALTYTLTATNDGNAFATGVLVTDDVPDSLIGVVASYDVDPNSAGGTGSCSVAAGNVVSCSIGTLAASDGNSSGAEPDRAIVTVTTQTTPASCGVLDNTAHVSSPDESVAGSKDNASTDVSVTVRCPNVVIHKSTTTSNVSAGDSVSYVVDISNSGTGAAKDVLVSDSLPGGLAWSMQPAVSGCGIAAGTLTCGFPTFAAGATVSVRLVASTTAQSCGVLDNTASVSASNEPTSSGADNTAGPVRITVSCATIDVTKTPDHTSVNAGDKIGFTMTIHNTGAGNAYGTTLSDPLPAGLAWSVDGGTAAGACTITGGTLSCAIGTLAGGASQTVHVSATTTPAACGSVSNTATATATNDGTDTSSASVRVDCPSLTLTKIADATVVSSTDSIGFSLILSSAGPGSAYGVTLDDPLPAGAGIGWTVSPAVAGCVVASGSLHCVVGTLDTGATFSVHLSSPTTADSCGSYPNVATATSTNGGHATAQASTRVDCPSIHIAKSPDATSVSAGQTAGFTIAVGNDGPGSAYAVTLNDPLPAGPVWTIDGGSAAGSCTISTGALACSLGTMGAGSSLSVHVSAVTRPADCGLLSNSATVDARNDDPETATASVTVLCPSIHLSKTPDAAVVNAGDQIGFTLTASNTGSGSAFDATIIDALPATPGTAWSVNGGTAAATCSIGGGLVSCAIGTLAPGSSATVHLTSATTTASCGVVENNGVASASNASTAHAAATVTVRCPSLGITKTADDASVTAGDPIGFTIEVSNAGPGIASSVTISDPLPSGSGIVWTIDGGTAAGSCSITTGTLSCAIGTLGAGGHASVHVSSPTTALSCGSYENTASAGATNGYPVHATATTSVRCASIQLAKAADDGGIQAGDDVGFTITVSNAGAGEARSVHVTDVLPSAPGTSWTIDAGSIASSCEIAGGTLTCDLASMAPGAAGDVHVASHTTGVTCGTLPNIANVQTANDGSAQAAAAIIVDCPVGIAITKDGPVLAHIGDTVTYVFTVQMTTRTPLGSVTLTDSKCDEAPVFLAGDGRTAGLLEKTEIWSYECTHVVAATDLDPLPNTATATGVGNDQTVSAQASHTVDIIHPAITIAKTVLPTSGRPGDNVLYTYVVKNTGDTPLHDVTVDDDRLGHVGTVHLLNPGQSVTLEKGAILGSDAGTVTNIGTATGTDPLNKKVTAHDSASVSVVLAVKLVATGGEPVGWKVGAGLVVFGALALAIGLRRKKVTR